MILVDTSVWVEYERATASQADLRLTELIDADGPVAVTEPIMMELLVGARSERHEADLRRLLLRFALLPFDPATDFDAAVRIYRRCRAAGMTPRGMLHCMIAAVAWRSRAILLTQDANMAQVADVIGIDVDPASFP